MKTNKDTETRRHGDTERICKTQLRAQEVSASPRLRVSASSEDALYARSFVAAPPTASGDFMFMPGGTHTVWLGRGAALKPTEVNVQVDRNSAAELQQQLLAVQARLPQQRPFFDFNHKDEDASFWPAEFFWSEAPQPGVYVRGEWSLAGKTAVEGKSYRSFSPGFHVDNHKAKPARIACNPNAGLNFGGLVNKPAFHSNLPLWAKDSTPGVAAQTPPTPTNTPQNRKNNMLSKEALDALRAKITTTKTEVLELQGREQTAENAELLQARQKDLLIDETELRASEAEARINELNGVLIAQRTKDANAAIAQAVARGALPPARTAEQQALHARYRDLIIEDPANISLLTTLRGSPALDLQPLAARQPRISLGNIAISRESNRDMLTGLDQVVTRNMSRPRSNIMQKRDDAREFAALYAREILPRLKEGDDIPLFGLDSLGTLAATIASTRTLELLTLTFPLLNRISTDFSDQIVSYGDTLKTRTISLPTLQTYNTATGWSKGDMTTVDVSITYNQHKGVPINLNQQIIAGTIRRLFDEIAPAQAYVLGKAMVDYVYTFITEANFVTGLVDLNGVARTTVAVSQANFGRSNIIDIGGALDDCGNPDMGRFLLLCRPYHSSVKKDPAIITLAAFSRPDIIERGVIKDVEDFDVIKAVNLPAPVGASGKAVKGFGGTRSSLVIASRLSADYMSVLPGAANGNLTVITTPGGFSANQVQYVDNALGTANQRLEAMWGANAGQGNAGQILTDA